MADDKKKQAMSLLFGDAPPKPAAPSRPVVPEATDEAPADAPMPQSEPEAAPVRARASRTREKPSPERTQRPAPQPDPYYQGGSRYRRASGDQVKHSVYLDPGVSRALKIAAATGDDPRGTNISAIVNEALRELGYGPR